VPLSASRRIASINKYAKLAGKPELICPPLAATGAIGKESQLLFFNSVLHLTARAVEFVIEFLRVP